MQVLTVNAKDFIRGESSAEYVADGGFSPSSYGLNLTYERGTVHFHETATQLGATVLTGDVIASAHDWNSLGNDKYFLDDGGAFYTLSGTTLTKRQTVAGTFQSGTSDFLQFQLTTYATSQDRVVQLAGGDLATLDSGWWTGLNTLHRHPMEIVEDELFIADGNVIYFWNGTSSGTAFTLPANTNVTSLRKAADGRTLLAFAGTRIDFSHTVGSSSRVYYCNPSLRDWEREVELVAQVEGTRVVEGVIYCTWGKNFGYFNGNGLTPMKRLATSGTTYSHNIQNMEDILLVRDGLKILAYGNLGAGNVWWNIHQENTYQITDIAYKGDNFLTFCNTNSELYQVDFDNIGLSGQFFTNRIDFGQEVKIRRIDLLHDLSNAGGTTRFILYYRDPDNTSNLIEDKTYSSESTFRTRIHCDITTDIFQMYIAPSNDDIGYKSIRIYYEPIK